MQGLREVKVSDIASMRQADDSAERPQARQSETGGRRRRRACAATVERAACARLKVTAFPTFVQDFGAGRRVILVTGWRASRSRGSNHKARA